jgi:hypothetical protein
LALVEDESDVKAAKELREEVKADYAEFDENAAENNLENTTTASDANGEHQSMKRKFDERVENEFKSIEEQVEYIWEFIYFLSRNLSH